MMGEKSKRLTPELIQAFIKDLERLPAEVDTPAAVTVFFSTQDLCRKDGLTAYDAAYLELAIRHRVALATADAALERKRSPRASRLCRRIVSTAARSCLLILCPKPK